MKHVPVNWGIEVGGQGDWFITTTPALLSGSGEGRWC